MGDVRIGRESVEVLIQTPGAVRVGRESVEVLIATPGDVRLGRMSVEVLLVNTPPSAVSFIGWGVPISQ